MRHWRELLNWAETTSDASPEHLSLPEWFFYFAGGREPDRSLEELEAHIGSCGECTEICKEHRDHRR